MVIKSFQNRKSGLCFPSLAKIAHAANCSRATVQRCVKELENAKFLFSHQMRTVHGKKMSSSYTIDDDRIPDALPSMGRKRMPKQCIARDARSVSPVMRGDEAKVVDFTEENRMREEPPTRCSLISKQPLPPADQQAQA